MNKDVSINIKAIQRLDSDEHDTTELFTCGRLTHNQNLGGYTLSYDENEVIGFDKSKVSLDITGDNMVIMRRTGDSNASLIIEKGKKHHCHYGTPYGDFMVGISAADVRCNLNDSDIGVSSGEMYLKYTVDINSKLMSENEMHIDFETVKE